MVDQNLQNLPEHLEGEEEEEGHHEAEESHGLGEGEPQDGVGEQLLLQARVPGVADDEGSEDGTDTSSWAGHTDGGGSSPDELGGGVDVPVGGGGLEGAGLVDGQLPKCRPLGQAQAGAGGQGQSADKNKIIFILKNVQHYIYRHGSYQTNVIT